MASLFFSPVSSPRLRHGVAIDPAAGRVRQCGPWTKTAPSIRGKIVAMGFKIVDSYDSTVELDGERDSALRSLLSSQVFCKQVAEQAGISSDVEFSGELFQPVPWSPNTTHGMPKEFEKYYEDKENYAIINVPPNFMFKAKVFKPSRLCAIYKKIKIKDESLESQ